MENCHVGNIQCVCLTMDNKFLYSAGADKILRQWKVDNYELEKDYGQIHEGTIKSMVVGKSGHYLFTGSYDKHIKCFDIYNQELTKDLGEVHLGRVQVLVVDDQRDINKQESRWDKSFV